MIFEYGAEKDRRLHRADTEKPVHSENSERSAEARPATFGIFQREYSKIMYYRYFKKKSSSVLILFKND